MECPWFYRQKDLKDCCSYFCCLLSSISSSFSSQYLTRSWLRWCAGSQVLHRVEYPFHLMRQKTVPFSTFFLRMSSTLQPQFIGSQIYYNTQMSLSQQYDDCFEVELNIKKVQNIFFLNPHRLLLLHTPNRYSVVDILDRSQTKVLKTDRFLHHVVDQIQPLNSHSVLYVHDNCLHLFDLFSREVTHTYVIPRSEIYEQQFQFQVSQDQPDPHIVFYKTSVLKSTPVTIYYDVHLLTVSKGFEKVKRVKVEHQDLRHFGFSCGELVSYQITGYSIEVDFIESAINHKINSIFPLFLIEASIRKEELVLSFTHEELQNELTCYEISKKRVKKLERRERSLQAHTYWSQSGLRSLVYKNCFNHRAKDHFSGIFRVRVTKESRYLSMMSHLLPESMGADFRQSVLGLLG